MTKLTENNTFWLCFVSVRCVLPHPNTFVFFFFFPPLIFSFCCGSLSVVCLFRCGDPLVCLKTPAGSLRDFPTRGIPFDLFCPLTLCRCHVQLSKAIFWLVPLLLIFKFP
uniref:Uncharacterized protein n=1 Tax=Trypanosoma vivax (strain Y486) TaxID=1055687 RepID=G0U9G1_TRYVY|nr:hypothetical protein TVY486_1117310 [Trypanosoma vivax Y486]